MLCYSGMCFLLLIFYFAQDTERLDVRGKYGNGISLYYFTSIPFLGVHLFVLLVFIFLCSKFISFMVCF